MFSINVNQETAYREYSVQTPYKLVLKSNNQSNLFDKAKVKETLAAVTNYSFLLECAANATEDYITDKDNPEFIKKAETARKVADQALEHLGVVKEKTGIQACYY
jgi:hypothetical protein